MNRKLFGCLLSWTLISGLSQLGWHGLVPLHSTKDDVTRLLGSSNDSNELRAKYNLPSEDVYIVFSNKDICGDEPRSVPAGTLLMIEVTPITKAKLATLQFDPRSYRKFDPSSPQGIGYEAYINDQEGVIIRAYKGEVDKLIYELHP